MSSATRGDEVATKVEPVMGAEDFAFYALSKPSAYLLVGMGGEKSAFPHHHPEFDIDEEEIGTAILSSISKCSQVFLCLPRPLSGMLIWKGKEVS